nr:PREDICTED: uncharacterized protein LOC109038668 [Bemisia tabaci]
MKQASMFKLHSAPKRMEYGDICVSEFGAMFIAKFSGPNIVSQSLGLFVFVSRKLGVSSHIMLSGSVSQSTNIFLAGPISAVVKPRYRCSWGRRRCIHRNSSSRAVPEVAHCVPQLPPGRLDMAPRLPAAVGWEVDLGIPVNEYFPCQSHFQCREA